MSMPTALYLRELRIEPNLVLAPMAGVTDSPFRRLIKELGGVGLIVTEFISVEGLTRGNLATHRMTRFLPEERPIAIQIFGYNEERMSTAAAIIEEGGADAVDINCGCPAKRVVKGGGGSSLLQDLPQLEKILRTVRRTVSIPLMLKIRSGWDESTINAVEVSRIAEDCGCDMITLHARTRTQGYGGHADWGLIGAVKKAISIPVAGSGDVISPQQAVQRFSETSVDAVMIGRGAIINPWIFRQIKELKSGSLPYLPSPREK